MTDPRQDAERYRRSRYHARPDRVEDGGADAATRGRTTAASYSRRNAEQRYGQMERHVSRGGKSLVEEVEEAAAARNGGPISRGALVKRIVIVLLVILVAAIAAWYVLVSWNMRPSDDVSGSVSGMGIGEPYYVLLMGSDSRNERSDVARADSIMLCRVDEANKQVTMVSLPRDLRVEIPGHGLGKLNSALAYDGYSGAIDAASKVAGVPISYYATIYFSGFKELVDDLGGVDVDVPAGTYYHGTWVNKGKEGKNVHINGKEALVLARCRHGRPADQGAYRAGDYQRTKNQRNLMKAIVKKIMKQPAWAVPGQVYTVSKCIESSMPAWMMAQVALAMRGMDADAMYSATAPAYGRYIGGVSYQILNESAWDKMMARVEAGEDPNG